MADLAARGYSGVLHTFSENDFAYYRDTMAEIVESPHVAGLTELVSPWVSGARSAARRRAAGSRSIPRSARCWTTAASRGRLPQQLRYRDFCKRWANWALECGVDSVFWDEPAWVVPAHVGVEDPARWTCRCDRCAERFGGPGTRGAHTRGAGFPRSLGRRLPARGHRPRRGARRLEHDLPAARDRGDAGPRRLGRGRLPSESRDAGRRIPTGSIGTRQPAPSCGASPACCTRRQSVTTSAPQLWVPSFGLDQEDIPSSKRPSRLRARRASTISGLGATKPAVT